MNITTNNLHEVQVYLLNKENPTRVEVQINGRKERIFVNDRETEYPKYYLMIHRSPNRGYRIYDTEKTFNSIEKIFYPKTKKVSKEEKTKALINKYKTLASKASFTNDFIRDCLKADETKTCYENHISSGVPIEGKCIKLDTIEKWCGSYTIREFKNAIKDKKRYSSGCFRFQGYDGTLWTIPYENGDIGIGFSKEYKGCGNGYYYLMINDDTFIGYDID